ncbi:hypothetical protein F2Q70_00041742 [Brassica cretica]|uniref:Aminoalcoholphosphotransferase n=1 Tax=Brassica cretica TaxID=69181 RepID=A0A8S9K3W3_BRACR|nr:hypothetical protein F2Q70_00041742 [Brassica cretica]
MGYIGAHGAAALHRYKYSGEDHSYLAKYLLNPFWTRFVKVFPLWMPPNMITLMGFMFLVTSSLLGYIYSPQLDSPPPRWVHFAHGLLLFLYQTFDAVDGKQARRTNSSSPLGELFDHGCDALACAFEAMAFGSTAMCGRDTFWFWVISAIPFYGATWEHYFTNTLILPVINGPTEGLALIYVSHFFTALVGAEWWAQQLGESIPLFSWVPLVNDIRTSRAVLYMMIAFAVIPTVAINFAVLLGTDTRKALPLLSPTQTTGTFEHMVQQLFIGTNTVERITLILPNTFSTLFGLVLSKSSLYGCHNAYGVHVSSHIFPARIHIFTSVGFSSSTMGALRTWFASLLVSGCDALACAFEAMAFGSTAMCGRDTFWFWVISAIPFYGATWEHYFTNTLILPVINGPTEGLALIYVSHFFTALVVSLYLHFATSVIHEITAALGIYCFRITKKLEKKP